MKNPGPLLMKLSDWMLKETAEWSENETEMMSRSFTCGGKCFDTNQWSSLRWIADNRWYQVKRDSLGWNFLHRSTKLKYFFITLRMESVNCFFCSVGRPPLSSFGVKQQFISPPIIMFSSANFRICNFKVSKILLEF